MTGTEFTKQCVGDLLAGIAERTAAEARFERDFSHTVDTSGSQLRAAVQSIEVRVAEELHQAEESAAGARDAVLQEFESADQSTRMEYETALQEIDVRYEAEHAEISREQADARWMVTSLLDDDSEANPKFQLRSIQSRLEATRKRLRDQRRAVHDVIHSAISVMTERRQWRAFGGAAPSRRPRDCRDALELFQESEQRIREESLELRSQKLPRIFVGWRPGILFLFVWAPLFVLMHHLDPSLLRSTLSPLSAQWTMVAAGISSTVAFAAFLFLFASARAASGAAFREICAAEVDLKVAHKRWLECAQAELRQQEQGCEQEYSAIVVQRQSSLTHIDGRAARRMAEWSLRRQAERTEANESFPARRRALAEERDRRLVEIDQALQDQTAAIVARRNGQIDGESQQAAQLSATRSSNEESARRAIAENWRTSLCQFAVNADQINVDADRKTVDWGTIQDAGWNLPEEFCESIPIGRFELDLARVADGVPSGDQLRPDRTQFEFPLLLPFPNKMSLVLKTRGDGRGAAVSGLKALMLRLLTSLPAGKVRFTVIDPVGLGEEFSAFMHLTDFDEQIIGTRIWTQTPHIEKRLTELSDHIENVFQAYLRNEFETIEDYNRQAGEVAEPYHFLVVANFPANFSETAARRLVSIATSGPRCGVYPIISVDTALSLPHNCDLADLDAGATTFAWNNGRFHLIDRELSWLPLQLDRPPAAEAFTEIVRSVGRQSKHSRRVEVPFERIAPRNGELWGLDSRSGIDVPLGRAGATKLQHLRLGQGTSQHVLVAGKTGSGKSTFLHALITNLALNYSPHEVEFFLIDFKKGVEFKTYATHSLPHARIVGIESDREFGVSVLERLDGVLKERGELFRRHGVQDLESFRKVCPTDKLPRILLVVDEFQEFFVEDDALSQSAGLLLDRLVRQGRAFGIHVLLGSQTLGGAYSLARSTLGQVAVRIALQCSETDAHLILSEDNTAARLLSRPGEAIYNDANGLLDGNHPFQVAWLPDSRRETYLRQIQEKATSEGIEFSPPIVFEGNVPSDPRRNSELTRTLAAFRTSTASAANRTQVTTKLWLGEAVSIKPPTTLAFRRRPGDNLLVVGQEAGSATGLLAVALIGLAAQSPTDESSDDAAAAQYYVVDGDDSAANGTTDWRRLLELIPHRTSLAGPRDVAQTIGSIAELVARRAEAASGNEPPVFLLISNLSRLRDLKSDGDDFGFASIDNAKHSSADRQLVDILRDGPAVGVHTIVWCDTYSNLNRWLSSQAQREFELRIAFQMNAADSSNLIDSPAASRLGLHRAILYLHESGQSEKFRPYTIPSTEWLDQIASCLETSEPVVQTCNSLSTWTII